MQSPMPAIGIPFPFLFGVVEKHLMVHASVRYVPIRLWNWKSKKRLGTSQLLQESFDYN